jgi:hypothetical protein
VDTRGAIETVIDGDGDVGHGWELLKAGIREQKNNAARRFWSLRAALFCPPIKSVA